ncbi:MAG: hypothetical protein LBR60_08255 [Fibrobacter sp.]|jgi:hypothetical protein|nr:hypothetical protein [Fibrobacter sp.]
MTNAELKKKISEAPEQEWFKTISVSFSFPLTQQLSFTGLTAIYEFINQQIDGWSEYNNLPNELNQSKIYFTNIKNSIIPFVNAYSQHNVNVLKSCWQSRVAIHFNINPNQRPLPYNIPQIDFLMKIHQDTPSYFQGAYHFMLKTNSYNINNPDFLYGAILVYEFTLKDHTDIAERRNAEKSSISKLRADFQKYLSESEQQLTTHLSNANTNYTDYAKKIDDLKVEKETLFTDWFENTKREQWQNWFDPKIQKIADLEETYKEKLKLEEPAKYWDDRAKKLKKQGWCSLAILVALVVVICVLLISILWNPPEIFKTSIFSDDKSVAIKWILIYATLLSFLAYCIRALSKIMFSAFHLARDCEERHALTYFYLSLLKDSKVEDSDRQLIMQSLFSRADTGLLKEDSTPTMPNDVISKVVHK